MINISKFPVKILCVDDEPTNLDILTRHLFRRVDTIIFASNGREGHALFLEHRPDIVLTDLIMPFIDGLEMSRMIRSIEPKVPVILLTSCNSFDFLAEAIDIGITQFLPKPILKEKLLTAVQRCYESIDLERRLKQERDHASLLSCALEQNPTAIIILDANGTVEYLNKAGSFMVGLLKALWAKSCSCLIYHRICFASRKWLLTLPFPVPEKLISLNVKASFTWHSQVFLHLVPLEVPKNISSVWMIFRRKKLPNLI